MKRLPILAAILCLVLTACTRSPSDVKLSNEKEILRWCKKNFGPCTLTDTCQTEDGITYTLRDTEKNFTYTVTCTPGTVGMDGTVFWYTEQKDSKFEDVYIENFLSQYFDTIETMQKRDRTYVRMDTWFTTVEGPSEDAVMKTGTELLGYMKAYDTREYWPEHPFNTSEKTVFLEVQGQPAGEIRWETGCMTAEETECNYLLRTAASEIGCPQKDLKFRSTEIVPVETLPEASVYTHRVNILGSDNDTKNEIRVAHFELDKTEYYVADLVVYDEYEGQTPYSRIRHLGNYQTRWEKKQAEEKTEKASAMEQITKHLFEAD